MPSAARRSAITRPIPPDAPVTIATRGFVVVSVSVEALMADFLSICRVARDAASVAMFRYYRNDDTPSLVSLLRLRDSGVVSYVTVVRHLDIADNMGAWTYARRCWRRPRGSSTPHRTVTSPPAPCARPSWCDLRRSAGSSATS